MSLYNVAVKLVRTYLKIAFSVKVIGIENIEENENYVVVSNHKSNYDPLVIAAFSSIPLTFMAKEELFKVPVLGYLLKKFGAFPIKRGSGDIGAMRNALKILSAKGNLLIFPEGTRYREEGKLLPGKSGAALVSNKSKTKILPVGISGKYSFKKEITLNIGKPINTEEYFKEKASSKDLQEFTDNIIMKDIAKLSGDKIYENICC